MTTAFVQKFKAARGTDALDPHCLGEDRLKVLWTLRAMKDSIEPYVTPAEVAAALCDAESISISRQNAAAILERERKAGTVARARRGGTSSYRLMQAGEALLKSSSGGGATYVNPANSLSEIRRLEGFLAGLNGTVKICDPYIDNKTLDFLSECKAASEIKLLTHNVLDSSKVRRDAQAFGRQHTARLQIRTVGPGLIHDRYIIHSGGMLILGTSLNGFSKKQSFMIEMGPDLRALTESAFDAMWNNSPAFQ